jgi:predicted Zn-dependent peptidase
VKNNFAAGEYRRLSSNMAILMQLIQNDGLGNWREINEAGPKLQAVTAADVQRVAQQYFTRENRAVAIYTRKADSPKTNKS